MSITRPAVTATLIVVVIAAVLATPHTAHADGLDTEVAGGALVGRTDAARDYGVDLEVLYGFADAVFLRARIVGGVADNVQNASPIHGPMFAGLVGVEGRTCVRARSLCFVGGLDLGDEVQAKIDGDGHDHSGVLVGFHAGLDGGTEQVRVRVIVDADAHHDSVYSDPPWASAVDVSVGIGYLF